MDKYKTSTFLTGLFCKFRLQDKDIRKIISDLYGILIGSILKETSEEKRILLFKSLVPIIKTTIEYFERLKKKGIQVDAPLFQVVVKLIAHCVYVIQKIGIRDNKSVAVFDNIMKQVLIDEIACDIGACVKEYKMADRPIEKSEITDRLKVLLVDYNVIMQTDLTFTDVLNSKKDSIK